MGQGLPPNNALGRGAAFATLFALVVVMSADGFDMDHTSTADLTELNGRLYLSLQVEESSGGSQLHCPLATAICNHMHRTSPDQNRRGTSKLVGFSLRTGRVLTQAELEDGLGDWTALV